MVAALLKLVPLLWPIFKKLLEGRGITVDKDEERKFQLEVMQLAQQEEKSFTRALEAVNRTMQAEAKSEHFMQWSWRPTIGFTFSGVIVYNYILRPLIAQFAGTALPPIEIPGEVWNVMLMAIGVSAATRGWQKVEQARNGRRNNNNVGKPFYGVWEAPAAPIPPVGGVQPRPVLRENPPLSEGDTTREEIDFGRKGEER